jgi:hypothetical protein
LPDAEDVGVVDGQLRQSPALWLCILVPHVNVMGA